MFNETEINLALEAYLGAALWAEELDDLTIYNFADNDLARAREDIENFCEKAQWMLDGLDPAQVGHDIWLTRNGHGTGFWDRGLGELGDQLTVIAEDMSEVGIYVGDSGEVHFG